MFSPSPAWQTDEFIRTAIDSVPHLESLLLLWTTRPRGWTADELAGKVYVGPARAQDILDSLSRRGLTEPDPTEPRCFRYASHSPEQDALVASVERAYKTDLIRITRMIHSKAAPALHDFAQAFRLKKD